MCGIAGIAQLDGRPVPDTLNATLQAMAQALRPRGPDDMQFVGLEQALMSFTRLSLVDHAGGRQPFVTPDGKVALSANGEIYNHRELRRRLGEHRFRSQSDCEVLLHLYLDRGLDFLKDVRGMFGIAVVDLRQQRLVLSRDRIGLKPMFVHRSGPTLVFGSEIKALWEHPAVPRRLNWVRSLADQGLNAAPIIPDGLPNVWFDGVEQIEPGTMRVYDLRDGSESNRRYWSMPEPAKASDVGADELIAQLRELLQSSTEECVVADAEVGMMLSGGVDSAGVAALARGTVAHSFSALTASTLLNGDTEAARTTARSLELEHHEYVFAAGADPSPDDWRRLVWLMESPLCGPEQYFKSEIYRGARATRPELKAMLLGSGADELAGGYSVMMSSDGDWHSFIRNLTDMSRRRALAGPDVELGYWWHGPRPLLRDDVVRQAHPGRLGDVYDDFVKWKLRDWQQYNFWVEDRTASGNAIEARVPYLDHRVVELLCAVPRELRPRLFWDKTIIRSALADVLPESIRTRPKVAFYEGGGVHFTHRSFARMLAANGGELLDQALSTPLAAQFLDADGLRYTLDEALEGRSGVHVELLLRLVNLGLLDEMTSSGRPEVEPGPPLVEITTAQYGHEREMVLPDEVIGPDAVLELGAGVLVLDCDEETSYIAVDGELRYVVDRVEEAEWSRLLRRLDGKAPLHDALTDVDADLDKVSDLISQALTLQVLRRAT